MTIEEVILYLRVNARTAYRLIHAGDLPAVRVGRQWRVRRGDLDEWLDRRTACRAGDRAREPQGA